MKAILNISRFSQYSKFNGLTFRVGDLNNTSLGLVGLDKTFPNNQTDFSFNEVIIVSLQDELDTYNTEKLKKLSNYCNVNKIDSTHFMTK